MQEDPREPITLSGALEQLRRQGFTADFQPAEGGLVAGGRGRAYRPDELSIREFYRFEGVSDPDDLSVVYALEAADGTRGVLVDAFGPYADPAVAAVLRDVERRAAEREGGLGPAREATWPPPSPAGEGHRRTDAA